MIYSKGCKEKHVYILIGLIAASCMIVLDAHADTSKPRITVFDLEMVNTSLEYELYGENPAEINGWRRLQSDCERGLRPLENTKYWDNTPATEAIHGLLSDVQFLHDCNNCEPGYRAIVRG